MADTIIKIDDELFLLGNDGMDSGLLEQMGEMAVFVQVVDCGGFTAAARRLGITKSAVSKKIDRLERTLGVRLLGRTTRSMSMTEAGQALYDKASQAVALAEEARRRVAGLSGAPRGGLRVTASVAFGKLCLAPLLPEFLGRYPEIGLQLALLDRPVDLAEEGFDAAIRLTRQPPDFVVAKPLMPIEYRVCASPDYLAGRAVETPAHLAGLNCLYYGQRGGGAAWIFRRGGIRETVKVAGNLVVNSSEVLRDMVLAGLGVGLVAAYAVDQDIRQGRLVSLLPDWRPEGPFGETAYVIWLPQSCLPPKVRVFADFLEEKFGPPSARPSDGDHR